jgi:microcystin-dependent protein
VPVHPCGTIVDAIRSSYSTFMLLWQDDPVPTLVRWQFASKAAKVLPGPTVFCSSNWDDRADQSPLGEQYPRARVYNKGTNYFGYTGRDFCGSLSAFETGGIHGITPEIMTDAQGFSPCCNATNQQQSLGSGFGPKSWQFASTPLPSGFGLVSFQGLGVTVSAHMEAFSTGIAYAGLSVILLADMEGQAVVVPAWSASVSTSASMEGQAAIVETGDDVLTGMMLVYPAPGYAPAGYLVCDGSYVSQVTYAALYAVIGTMFGPVSGSNFKLPDFRGRTFMGYGAGPGLTPRSVGDMGGVELVTLSAAQSGLPAHTHGPGASTYFMHSDGTINGGAGASEYGSLFHATATAANAAANAAAAHENTQPWLCGGPVVIKT